MPPSLVRPYPSVPLSGSPARPQHPPFILETPDGFPRLILNEYIFRITYTTPKAVLWACTEAGCPAGVFTALNVVEDQKMEVTGDKHTHKINVNQLRHLQQHGRTTSGEPLAYNVNSEMRIDRNDEDKCIFGQRPDHFEIIHEDPDTNLVLVRNYLGKDMVIRAEDIANKVAVMGLRRGSVMEKPLPQKRQMDKPKSEPVFKKPKPIMPKPFRFMVKRIGQDEGKKSTVKPVAKQHSVLIAQQQSIPIAMQQFMPIALQQSKSIATQQAKPVAKQQAKPVAMQQANPVAKQIAKPRAILMAKPEDDPVAKLMLAKPVLARETVVMPINNNVKQEQVVEKSSLVTSAQFPKHESYARHQEEQRPEQIIFQSEDQTDCGMLQPTEDEMWTAAQLMALHGQDVSQFLEEHPEYQTVNSHQYQYQNGEQNGVYQNEEGHRTIIENPFYQRGAENKEFQSGGQEMMISEVYSEQVAEETVGYESQFGVQT